MTERAISLPENADVITIAEPDQPKPVQHAVTGETVFNSRGEPIGQVVHVESHADVIETTAFGDRYRVFKYLGTTITYTVQRTQHAAKT